MHVQPIAMRSIHYAGAAMAVVLAHTRPASAEACELEAAVGAAVSNAGLVAPALNGRVGLSLDHVAFALRGIGVAGGDSFSGWMALAEARLHSGEWLRPVRLHLALSAGVGREIAASGRTLPDGDSSGFESGKTGRAFLGSVGADTRFGSLRVILDVAAFYWSNVEIVRGTSLVSGGLGGAVLVGVGF